MTPEELALHRELIAAFNAYIKANLIWEDKRYDKEAVRARHALRRIINAAYLRWKEIHNCRVKTQKQQELVVGKEFFRELGKRQSRKKGGDNTST